LRFLKEEGMGLRTFSVLLSVLLFTSPAAAQEQRGSIEGVVKDTSGAVLPGVTVEARSAAGAVLATVTDGTGTYRFPSVLPGMYELNANLASFKAEKVSDIPVALGQVKTVDFTLKLAGVTEQVNVTGESPLVDVKQSTRATNIRAEQVELLPHNRDFTSMLTQAPGTNYEPKSGSTGIMIDGASAAENRYIVDGMETTDIVHGQSGKNVLADFIEEVQVKSSGYPAEYGGSTGGVINVITKSGTNKFSGNILGYWQGDKTTSRAGAPGLSNASAATTNTGTPVLRLNPSNTSAAEYITYPADKWNRFEPGGALGGPIVKDKAWFFAAYQPALTSADRTVTLKATNSPITTNVKQQDQFLTANQTMQISDKLRTRVAFNNSWRKVEGLQPSLDGSDNPRTNYSKGTTFPNWLLSGNADYIFTPAVFVGVRAGYFRTNQHDFNVPDVSRFAFGNTTNIGMAGVPVSEQHPAQYTNVLSNNAVNHDLITRTYLQADGTWYAHAGGDHQIKGGIQIDRRAEDIVSGELGHRVTLRWGQSLSTGSPLKTGPFGYYSVRSNAVLPKQGFITQGNVQSNLAGLFIQDGWTVSNKLTINAGLRTENEKVPSYTTAPGVTAYPISFGFKDKLAPRAGFSYDVNGDGRWKAYGSWGIFYDIFKLELPQGSFGGQKWLEYYYTLDTPNFETLDQGANCPPQCSGTLIQGPVDFRAVSVTPGQDIEQNLKPMRSQEAALGVEHQIGAVMAVSVRYVHKQLDRGIEDTGSRDPATASEIYIIANPGEGQTCCFNVTDAGSVFTPNGSLHLPKMKRQYDGVELALEKRFSRNWFFRGSYLLSRDYGNYPGLSESDENGRSDPNVGRLFDYPLIMFKGDGTPSYGPLPTDRTHQVKLAAIYQFPFGTSIGVNQYVQSGIPISREVAVVPPNNYPVQYEGRGSDGRMDMFVQTDLYLQHEFRIGGSRRLQLSGTVLNLFNRQSVNNVFVTQLNGAGISVAEPDFYSGKVNFNSVIQSQLNSRAVVLDPRFLKPNGYQAPILARFGVKLLF
jgi:hypothetical protein